MIRSMLLALGAITITLAGTTQLNGGPIAAAQSLFDIMAKHDAEAGRALFTPDATMTSINESGKATVAPAEKWLSRIAASKDNLVERMWNPQVLERGAMAVVWGSYDFHVNGIFHHCGVDSFNLLKTDTGWKLASVTYTSETKGCDSLGKPPTR